LAVLTVSYGPPLVIVVAMKLIAAEFGTSRSGPALAVSRRITPLRLAPI
jgi:hypothetical protein